MAHPHLTRLTTYDIEDSNIALLGSEVSDPVIWTQFHPAASSLRSA